MAIRFRSPVNGPLFRQSDPVPPVGQFRVTQRFDDPDYYQSNLPNPPNPLPTHRATDIGNRRGGDPILAMANGIAYRVQDNAIALGAPNNALGIVVDHGNGIRTAYWHLASWTAGNGANVVAGQEVGKLGNTGLGQTYHCHIEALDNGVKFDPEPLMFGGTLGEDDVRIPAEHEALVQGVIAPGVNIRSQPDVTSAVMRVDLNNPTQLAVAFFAPGRGYFNINGVPGRNWWAVIVGDELGYVAEPLLVDAFATAAGQRLVPKPTGTGITQAQLEAARLEGFTAGKSKAKVAVEAITP